MKEINSKILDNFFVHSHHKSFERFTCTVFQDVCQKFSLNEAYSRSVHERLGTDHQNNEKTMEERKKEGL